MSEELSRRYSQGIETEQPPVAAQGLPLQAEAIIDGQVFRKTVLPAFTREDAKKKHRVMMSAYMNDDRYQRPHRSGRDGNIECEAQDRYYDS
jgi:hypothetical protein